MPTFKIQGPDGRVMQINAADGPTAMRMAQQQYAGGSAKPTPKNGGPLDFLNGASRAFAEGVPVVGGLANRGNAAIAATVGPAVEPLLDMIPGHDRSQDVTPGGISALVRGVNPGDNWKGRYDRALAMQNGTDAKFSAQHPIASGGANLAGGILGSIALARGFGAPSGSTPKPPPQGMLSKLASAGKAVGAGGLVGAADGAARAPDGHQLEGALVGGATGAATTGGLMVAGKALKAAGAPLISMAANRLGPPLPGSAIAKAPARQAATYVAKKLSQAGVDLPALKTSAAPTAAEAGGNTTRNALAALARQPGDTSEEVSNQLGERRSERANRILGVVAKATGIDPEGARGTVDAIIAKGQADATPLFDAVRATPGPVWNADLAAISQRPAMKSALKATAEAMQNAGKDPFKVGLAIDPDTGGFKVGNDLGAVTEPQPTAEAWENVRQMLGDLGKESPNMSNTQRIQAKGYQAAQRDLTTALAGDETGANALVPGYRDALNVAGDYKSVEGAFNGARGKLFSSKFTPADFSDLLDGATPGEQNAVRHAVAADLHDAAQNGRLTLNATKSPALRAKLALAFGGDAANQIGDTLSREAEMQGAEQQILPQGGSQTAPLSAAIKEQQENPLGDFAGDAISHTVSAGGNPVHGVSMAALKTGMKSLSSALKTPGMGTDARNEAGRLLLMSPDELHAYLHGTDIAPQLPTGVKPSPLLGGVTGGALAGMMLPQPDHPAYASPQ